MNQNKVISTAVLLLLLGATLPAFAEKGQEQRGGGKAPQAQHQASQHAQRAQPQQAQHQQSQRAQRAQPQRAQQAQRQQSQHVERAQPQRAQQAQRQQSQHVERAQQQRAQSGGYNRGNNGYQRNGNNGGNYGRISNANYHEHFGHGHSFHMGHPQFIGGYNRFQYGGYWFGYNEGWPLGWGYDDDVYVDYVGGAYFMYNLRHPGVHIALNVF
jgi:hypothetical protein